MSGIPVFLAGCISVSAQPFIGSEFQVTPFTITFIDQRNPDVGVADSGEFVVVWNKGTEIFGAGIFARRFDSSGKAVDPWDHQVNAGTRPYDESPSMSVRPNGSFVVAWEGDDGDGLSWDIFARRYDSSGVPIDPAGFQVNSYTTDTQIRPCVSMADSGDFVVVWASRGQDGDGYGIFARRFSSNGSPLDPADVQVNTYTTSEQFLPSVSVAPSGAFVVTWESYGQDGSGYGIFARRFDSSGVPLDPFEFQVNAGTASNQTSPSLGTDDSGDFVVAWQGKRPSGLERGIFARRFDSAGSPLDTDDLQVDTFTNRDMGYPDLAVDPSGDFIVTWQSVSPPGFNVFGRRFVSSGVPIDANSLQLGTNTLYPLRRPAVSVAPSGNFVVTWEGYTPTANAYRVYARRGCLDNDADGICNAQDILITSPKSSDLVDCRARRLGSSRPLITWHRGRYDVFRVQVSWDPSFPKGDRITSGQGLLTRSRWRPGDRAWQRVCSHAGSQIYVRVFGKDLNVRKSNLRRRTFSNVVVAGVEN